ncbi:hypothetical protein [Lysinibacillus sp. NPDC047702]|uniref:hypothetical protein n=1 Tax=unclassified Lysinibacillus TaxID=2636778 RepID=UPI003CFFBB8F
MKMKFGLIVILLLCCGLIFIYSSNSKIKATFIGVIQEINGHRAVVYVNKTEDSPISGIIYVNLAMNPNEIFLVGDKVKVGYDGTMRDSAPIEVTTLTVELVE